MRKNYIKIASVLLAATLLTGCGQVNTEPAKTSEISSSLEEIMTVANVSKTSSNSGSTVYVVTGTDGEVEKVLDNNETSIPVDIKITYTLNGEPISPENLAGKSGHVTIRFDYTNKTFEYVELEGESKKVYVPFTMVSGMLLEDEHFSNIEITNGKLIDDGNRTIALGLAFPGLKENLSLEDYDINVTVPEYVEVSFDATDFSLGMTLSIATNEVFSEIKTDDINTVDDLKESLDKLNDAMDEILDGSEALYDGLDTLYGKVNELSDGVTKLSDGATKLSDGASELADGAGKVADGAAQVSEGASKLNSGASTLAGGASELAAGASQLADGTTTLSNGAKDLADGLATLAANNDTLNGAAKTVFETLLSTASNSLREAGIDVTLTIDNYGEVLIGVAQSLETDSVYLLALSKVTDTVEANSAAIESGVATVVEAQVRTNVEAQVRAGAKDKVAAQVAAAAKENIKTQVTNSVMASLAGNDEAMAGAEAIISATVEAKYNEYLASEEYANTVNSYLDAYMASEEGVNTVNAYVNAYMSSDEAKSIISSNVSLKKQQLIDENMNGSEVQGQLAKASEGLKTIANLKSSLDSYNQFYVGLRTYTAGVAQAAGGASSLYAGSVSVMNGANTLSAGANTLSEGAKTLSGGAATLADGASSLSSGAGTLSAGTHSLYEGSVELKDGVNTLKDSMPALIDGVGQLKDGANALDDGLNLFNEEGIQKLNSVVTDDIETIIDRFRATVNVSKNYTKANSSDENSSVKFIFRSGAID